MSVQSDHHEDGAERRRYQSNIENANYLPINSKTFRMGASETLMNPSSGRLSSRTRQMAEETEMAQTQSEIRTVAFRGANKPKLRKSIEVQPMRRASRGVGRTVC